MRKRLVRSLVFGLASLLPGSYLLHAGPAGRPGSSSCSNAHGWMTIATDTVSGPLNCFSPQIHDEYASIDAGSKIDGSDIKVDMNFLSRAGTHTCRMPMVEIDLTEGKEHWTALRLGSSQHGSCEITQSFENGRMLWKGRATAALVVVRGNTAPGSRTKSHSESGTSGIPTTRKIQVEWEFDSLAVPRGRASTRRR